MKNIGTLVGAPIRINDSDDTYPSAYSSEIKGGRRVVNDLTALYALSSKPDQLEENVTIAFVVSENKDYKLIDINNIGNSTGWEVYSSGGGGSSTNSSFIVKQLELSDEEVILLWDTELQQVHGTRPVYIDLYEITSTGSVQSTARVYTEDNGVSYKWYVSTNSPRNWEIRIMGYVEQPPPPVTNIGFSYIFPFIFS